MKCATTKSLLLLLFLYYSFIFRSIFQTQPWICRKLKKRNKKKMIPSNKIWVDSLMAAKYQELYEQHVVKPNETKMHTLLNRGTFFFVVTPFAQDHLLIHTFIYSHHEMYQTTKYNLVLPTHFPRYKTNLCTFSQYKRQWLRSKCAKMKMKKIRRRKVGKRERESESVLEADRKRNTNSIDTINWIKHISWNAPTFQWISKWSEWINVVYLDLDFCFTYHRETWCISSYTHACACNVVGSFSSFPIASQFPYLKELTCAYFYQNLNEHMCGFSFIILIKQNAGKLINDLHRVHLFEEPRTTKTTTIFISC